MNSELYALAIRALIHGQHSGDNQSNADCKSYQMVEKLRQIVNFNEEFHQKILTENENCIEYSLEVGIEKQSKTQRFLLQISRGDDGLCAIQESIISNDLGSTVELRHGKCSLIRVFTSQIDTHEESQHKKLGFQKSSSFLKRWCRLNGRANALLTVKVKDLIIDQINKFQINTSPKATLLLKLKQNQTSGKELKVLSLSEFKSMIECFYSLVLEQKIRWEFVFDVLKLVAIFYDLPSPTWKLLLLGVILEGQIDEEKTLDHFSFILQKYFQQLRSASLQKSEVTVEAALLLSSQLLNFVEEYLRNSPTDVFFPIFNHQQSHTSFHLIAHHLSSIFDVAHLSFWDHNGETLQVQTNLSIIFEKKLQKSVGSWLHDRLIRNELTINSGSLCDVVDELHIVLRLCTPLYQDLFQKAWLSYLKTVVEIIEDPLCHLCEQTLLVEVAGLYENAHDSDRLIEFSKESMKLFDALRQFVEFITSQGQVTRLQKFELWFEKPSIFWTSSWRVLYLGFIKKSLDAAENGENTPCDLTDVLDIKKCDVEVHGATVNCLAVCKALCDDFVRLNIHNIDISLICVLQIIPILTDCLNLFSVQIFQQLKKSTTICNLLKSANGIEHACNHLMMNFERFLQLGTVLSKLEVKEREQIVCAIRRVMISTENRCKQLSTEIVNILCTQNFPALRKFCSQVTNFGEPVSRRKLRFYVTQVFTSDGADQLLFFLDKLCTNFKYTLLPRLHSIAMNFLWIEIRNSFTEQLAQGQSPEYYQQINRDCETICKTIGINWSKDNGTLRDILHLNCADTKELILQYYSKCCDLTNTSRPTSGTPRVHLRVGYIRTTNRQILLHIYALCAYDIPILDTLTKSADPYLRLELYPRYLFPLTQFPAQTSETRKQTLEPKWNQAFEISVPEDYFFMNGCCLCVTVLDHDIVSYNDLAGQALLPLASIPKLKSLSTKHLPSPIVLPLTLPNHPNQYDEHFRILEKRGNKDKLAREVVCYEKYLRSYRILPPCAEDEKEYRIGAASNRRKIKRIFSQVFQKVF